MHFTALFVAAASACFLLPTIVATPLSSPLGPTDLARRGQLLQRNEAPHDLHFQDDDTDTVLNELEKVFSVIEEIPDEVLEEGDDATNEWMTEHGYRSTPEKRDLEERQLVEIAKCAAAIAAFIASNAIGAAKLLRIKKYIAALGGIRKSAELLLKASTNAERLQQGGEFLALLAGEILGFSLISNNC